MLSFYMQPPKGYVVVPSGMSRRQVLRQERQASLRWRRSSVTLMTTICDDKDVQRCLPQTLVVATNTVPLAVAQQVQEHMPCPVRLLRRSSKWVDKCLMCDLLDDLCVALQHFRGTCHFVLALDTAPPHLPCCVLNRAARGGISMCYIAWRMTSRLQPCDTRVFAELKRRLCQAQEALQLLSSNPEPSMTRSLLAMGEAVHDVVCQRAWSKAFDDTGLRAKQSRCGQSLAREPCIDETLDVSCDLPSLEQLQSVFRKGCTIPIGALFQQFLPKPKGAGKSHAVLSESMAASSFQAPMKLRSGYSFSAPQAGGHVGVFDAVPAAQVPQTESAKGQEACTPPQSPKRKAPRASRLP